MKLSVLNDRFAICHLPAHSAVPDWVNRKSFWSTTNTQDEFSVICAQEGLPADTKAEKGWKIIKIEASLDFSLTGILASIANPLAEAKISIFSISTFDTDYVLVREENLANAKKALLQAGFYF